MKFILPALVAIALSTSAYAANVGARTSTLECNGTLNSMSGDFKNGFVETPVAASIKLSGEDIMRYGARILFENIEVKVGEEIINVKNVRDMEKYSHFDVVMPYENLLITDLSWYQKFRDEKNVRSVTPNNISIKGLPKTMTTTGDGPEAQDGATRSVFDAKIDMNITNGKGRVKYVSHVLNGTLSCVFNESL